ncbi:MAG: GTPase [Pseudohongiellaceae bacterium]
MRGGEKLRRALLRWDHLLMGLVLGLPFVVLTLLGFLWLVEHGFLLWFIGASLLLSAVVFALRGVLRKRWHTGGETGADTDELSVEPDPDWLPREKEVFAEVSRHIATITREAWPWEDLPEQALEVVNQVAAGLDGKNRRALNFTLPEALLLLESTASRYRDHLRRRLPFADQVSLATLHWFWRQRNRANVLWKVAYGSGRLARFALNPAAGVLRELEQIVSGGNSRYVTGNMMGVLQAILLEEVAYGAIDLYSGRLRFSEAELMQIELASATADQKRQPLPDLPLRILFVGQTSAGKSTLINVLLDTESAETDAAATTDKLIAYPTELESITCHFLDSEGLDGSSRHQDSMLTEMTQADLIVWVIRANRPAREVDRSLKERFDAWFEGHPRRRRPVVIAVATAMDQLVSDLADGGEVLSGAAGDTVDAVVRVIARDLGGLEPVPVSTGLAPWNLEAVSDAMRAALPEAQAVQRNRRRVEGARREKRLRGQVRKGVRGVKHGVKTLRGHWSGSPAADEDERKPPE